MLACQLLPLLQRTLIFTITRTSGAGGRSIGVHLNYSRIVKRVDSELFRLFDSFLGRLRKNKCGTFNQVVRKDHIYFLKSDSLDVFKIEASEGDIDEFTRSFAVLLEQGYGWDKDEYGNTVLHVGFTFVRAAATNI